MNPPDPAPGAASSPAPSPPHHAHAWQRALAPWFTAVQFFTRLPVPGWVGWSPQQAAASVRHLPAVGALVGGVCGLVLVLALQWWSVPVAVGLAMAAGVLLTGGLHEDGLADSSDGLGGGADRDQALAIFKDSRVGTYGVLALVGVLGLKAALWVDLVEQAGGLAGGAVLVGLSMLSQAASRAAALYVMCRLDYVRPAGSGSKSEAVARRPGAAARAVAAGQLLGVAAVPLLAGWPVLSLLAGLLAALAVGEWAVGVLRRRLGGYVGDTLGATQQLSELVCLLALSALWGAAGGEAAVESLAP